MCRHAMIVRKGQVFVSPREQDGETFSIKLPDSHKQPPSSPSSSSSAPSSSSSSSPTLLLPSQLQQGSDTPHI